MIQVMVYRLEGLSPLLMNNATAMESEDDSVKARTKKYDNDEEARKRLYVLDTGQLYVSSSAIRASLLKGSTNQKVGKYAAKGLVACAVFCVELECPLVHPTTGKSIKDYVVNLATVVVNKARIVRARPEIKKWALDVVFEVDDQYITPDQVEFLLNRSGKMAGLLDNRPSAPFKPGPYGRYTAKLTTGKAKEAKGKVVKVKRNKR